MFFCQTQGVALDWYATPFQGGTWPLLARRRRWGSGWQRILLTAVPGQYPEGIQVTSLAFPGT